MQTADIDMADCTWVPIGDYGAVAGFPVTGTKFTGTYDGAGKTISNLSITPASGSFRVGFFGHVEGATITSLVIESPVVTLVDDYAGVLAGYAVDTSISGIEIRGAAVTGDSEIGGLVGRFEVFSGAVELSEISFDGLVTTTGEPSGGLIANVRVVGSGVELAVADIDVTATVDQAGNMYYVGGLFGQVDLRADALSITRAHVEGDVRTAELGFEVGGLIGKLEVGGSLSDMDITDVSYSGDVDGSTDTGGLIGLLDVSGGTVDIARAAAIGSVSVAGDDGGGFIGEMRVSGGSATVSESFALGDVTNSAGTSVDRFGGFVAFANATSSGTIAISDSHAMGDVGASVNEIGGLVGRMSTGVTVDNSYSIGAVSGTTFDEGGLIGTLPAPTSVTDAFWDTSTSSQATSAAGTGKTTAEMQSLSTFDTAGWSISDGGVDDTKTWGICGSYPFLMWAVSAYAECLPGAPTAVTASGEGGVASVSWTAASVVGSAAVSSYTVTADPGGATCTATAPAVTCDVSGLTVGTSYTFSVTATNAVGTGPAGVSAAFVMSAAPTTTTPTTTPATTPSTTAAPAASPVPVRDVDGNLPSVSDPSKAVMVVNGVVSFLDVVVEEATRLVVSGDGFEMALAGSNSSGESTRAGDSGRLEVTDGGLLQVSGTGFDPGSVVEIFVMSDPVFAGTVTVGADGTFAGSVPVPEGLVVGPHTVQANGVTADGVPRSLNLGIELVETAVLPATGGGWSAVPLVLIGVGALGLLARRRTI